MNDFCDTDLRHMHHALMLARRGLGRVTPNPAVGCVIVNGDIVVGRGWTQIGGRPHAETVALQEAGAAAEGATVYVTMEPCAHQGETGPCAHALVDAGVERVVVASDDPDIRVDGQGYAILRAASIRVETGCMKQEADIINRGFLLKVTDNRPMYTLKAATRPDGSMRMREGEPRWITGVEAREMGHLMRANHDAIMIGIETALTDDPMLDCRLPALEDRSPTRIVMDRKARLPIDSRLVQSAKDIPLIVVSECASESLTAAGVTVIEVDSCDNLQDVSAKLVAHDLTRVLVEGGPTLLKAFMAAGLVDEIVWFRAEGSSKLTLEDTITAFGEMGLAIDASFAHTLTRDLGVDRLEVFSRQDRQ